MKKNQWEVWAGFQIQEEELGARALSRSLPRTAPALVILSHDEELSLNNLYGLDVIISQLHVWHITLEKIIYKSRNV